ncbi:MAG: DUF420 domain-containing protein [Armatimonadetes bacterium]|nr:DUF420 domain-containing protein [Armatimonadota bacterium]
MLSLTSTRARSPIAATVVITAAAYAALGFALTRRPPAHLAPALAQVVALLPHVIAVINTAALACLLLGWRAVRRGDVGAHRRYMLAATALISAFLVLYVTRVSLGGVKAFPGPRDVYRYLYLPALSIHVLLSILSVPPVVYNVVVGLTHDVAAIPQTRHPGVGRVAVRLWGVSLALGLLVYVMLNHVYR